MFTIILENVFLVFRQFFFLTETGNSMNIYRQLFAFFFW